MPKSLARKPDFFGAGLIFGRNPAGEPAEALLGEPGTILAVVLGEPGTILAVVLGEPAIKGLSEGVLPPGNDVLC